MDFIKKLLGTMFGLAKKGIDLLRGKNLEDLARGLGFALIGLFVLVCTGKSLKALKEANRKAGKSRSVHHGRKKSSRNNSKKKSLVKKLVRKVLLG